MTHKKEESPSRNVDLSDNIDDVKAVDTPGTLDSSEPDFSANSGDGHDFSQHITRRKLDKSHPMEFHGSKALTLPTPWASLLPLVASIVVPSG